jgi:PTH1 family peptidyl-tRNA hydrolase
MFILVGLGNPGPEYAATRHNIGANCLEYLSRNWHIPLERRGRYALVGQGQIRDEEIVLAKPRSYMNSSGTAIAYLVKRFRVTPQRILLLYDDMDIPLGTIRIRFGGGPGGHRGMGSVIDALGTQEIPRLRIGIGRPPLDVDEVTYVLGVFTAQEVSVIQKVRTQVIEAVDCILSHGLATAMAYYNSKKIEPEGT